VISEWKLEEKLVAVAMDDAANIAAAIRQVHQTDGCQEVKQLPCFAHTLNLVVQQAAQAINDLKIKVKTSLHKNIASIKKVVVRVFVRYAQSPDVIHTACCLLELLYVKHRYSSLSLFSRDELVYAISYLSTV